MTLWGNVDDTGKETLECMRICLGAVLKWNDMHIQALEKKLDRISSSKEKKQLLTKIEICKRIPLKGAGILGKPFRLFIFHI